MNAHAHRHPAGLQRRLFAWFGAAILVTGLVVSAVFALIERAGGSPWQRGMVQVSGFLAARFADVWERPAERAALADELARTFEVGVELFDTQGRPVGGWGAPGPRTVGSVPVVRAGTEVGRLRVSSLHRRGPGWRFAVVLAAAGVALWGASGFVARRLSRPFRVLAGVAHAIGDGELSARVPPMRRTYGEVAALAGALNEMAERIERQLRDQRELLAAVSHEMRTPLARMRILVELLRGRGGDPKMLEDLDRETVEMDGLVGELLASARLDFQALSLQALDPAQLAARALERQQLPASLLELEAGIAPLQGDPTLLGRALANLLDNAQRHGGGAVRLRVRAEAPGVEFLVQDEGPGVSPEQQQQLFRPFSRQPGSEGLGLGLALVQRIAEAHGGRAFARARTPHGAELGFWIPARRTAPG